MATHSDGFEVAAEEKGPRAYLDADWSFTIAFQTYFYQRRNCWMLSSLLQQQQCPKLIVDIGFMPENGDPHTEDVLLFFEEHAAKTEHLSILRREVADFEVFCRRGLLRNLQMQGARTGWMLFADGDLVFHPEFFARLRKHLENNPTINPSLISAGRMTTQTEVETNLIVNKYQYPMVVEAAFQQASTLSLARRSNIGAGFFQLINLKEAPHEGYYVNARRSGDVPWTRGVTGYTRSDIKFRKRIQQRGGFARLPDWFTENLLHLNHFRDRQHGDKFLWEQR